MKGKRLILTDGEKTVYEEAADKISECIGEGNDFMYNDVSSALEYLDSRFGNGNDITVNICEFLDESDIPDGIKTRATFWIAAILMRSEKLRDLPYSVQMKFMPAVLAKTNVHEINLRKSTDNTAKLLVFSRVYRNEKTKLFYDECTVDEVIENILNVFPDRKLLEREIRERPIIIDILKDIGNMAECCADPALSEKMKSLMESLY